jgi:predicted ester cyclase
MSARKNEALVCRFLSEAYNKGNLEIGQELLADDCVFHASGPDIEGVKGWKRFAAGFLSAFPDDLQITIEDTIAKGSKVAVRWTASGTQTGQLGSIGPTNRQLQWLGMALYQLPNGKIKQVWGGSHPLSIM